jgi:ribosomal protein S18 acetylase RimI-like enzyme
VADRQPPEITLLGSNSYSHAGMVLGRAFQDDPLWTAVMPDPEERRAQLTAMFSGLAKTTVAAKGVAETTSGIEGVALWLPPGRDIGLWAMLTSGLALPRFAMRLRAPDRRRMSAVLRQVDQRRKELMPEPHWYLSAIGVEPESQGRGVGSALVRSGIEKASHEDRPLYLETETKGNVGYYEHLGFEVVEEMVAREIDLPLWLMIRRSAARSR